MLETIDTREAFGLTYVDPSVPSKALSESIEALDGFSHEIGLGYSNSFDNMLPGQSGRVEFTRDSYEYFRPSEAIPKRYADAVATIDAIYGRLSIVRNIIDLMSDFGSEGIKIVHPVKSIEKFYQDWFKKVNGIDRSERFLSCLYRHGMVVVRKMDGTVSTKKIQNLAVAEPRMIPIRQKENKIPLKYLFYNPGFFTHENYHDINAKPKYIIQKPKKIYSDVLFERNFYDSTPEPIGDEDLFVQYYKKDDWNPKPTPFLFPIIKHAIMLEKLCLADSSALDGAISKIRIIRVGNTDKNLYPSPAVTARLQSILRSNTSGGTIDIIWNPDIDIIESNTDIHQFLGQEKYVPHLTQVYEGLGIPASFVGIGSGTTNNFISLKIMMRRLMSGRERLVQFWDEQLKLVQITMGFSEPASLEFNNLDLGDEESERNLLIQLLDREVVSEERVLNILGFDPRLENKRIRRESSERKRNKRPNKAGQYHTNEKEFVLTKTSLERGYLAPEHVGVNKKEGTEEVPTPQEVRFQAQETKIDQNNGPGGRPPGSKDQVPRKTPRFVPKIKASLDAWVTEAQAGLNDSVKKYMLQSLGKKSIRNLTEEEFAAFEKIKFGLLLNLTPYQAIDDKYILDYVGNMPSQADQENFDESFNEIKATLKREPTSEECRMIQRNIYIELNYGNF